MWELLIHLCYDERIVRSKELIGYLSLSADKGYQEYLKSPVSLKVDKKSTQGSIKLKVYSTDKCGCYLEKQNDKKEIWHIFVLQDCFKT
ncbi:MAG: hypothetical protein NT144_09710 [Bacteroidia bacterium]|nr:hypothetical protein [Bacteroidia bacterium]